MLSTGGEGETAHGNKSKGLPTANIRVATPKPNDCFLYFYEPFHQILNPPQQLFQKSR